MMLILKFISVVWQWFLYIFAVITLDLTDSSFHRDSKKHNRVLWALKEKKPLEFDFLLAWYNTGKKN